MSPGKLEDLTYGRFTQLRAAALARLHGAQALQARIANPAYTPLTAESISMVNDAVARAKENLAQVLDAWARSPHNRME